jgi:hypothetical protein
VTLSPSPAFVRARRLRVGSALATGALVLIVLAGCANGAEPASTTSPTATPTTVPTASATPSPSPTPTPAEDADTAVTLGCDQVLTPDDVYDFNPNFGAAPGYKPADGSAAAVAALHKGVACGWSNQTSGDLIEVSVAQPTAATLADLKSQAAKSSTSVTTYGSAVKGYFATADGTGEAQIFSGPYWVAVTSVEFVEARDAETLVAAVVSHLQ